MKDNKNKHGRELEKAKDDIIVNEEKLRALVENSPDHILNIAEDGTILYINRPALGHSVKNIIGKNVSLFADEEYIGPLKKLIHKTYSAGKSGSIETRKIQKDGTPLWFEIRISPLKLKNRVIVANLIIRDITERKKIEEALQENERKFRQITENMRDIIVLTDFTGKIEYLSPSILDITKHRPNDLLGKNMFDYFHPDDLSSALLAFQDKLLTKPQKHAEIRFLHADGHYIWLEGIGKPIYDEKNNITGFLASCRDITRRKQIEEELQKYREHLEELVEERTAEIKKARDELEQRVRERTAELTKAYEQQKRELEQRKIAEEALRESEYRYRMIAENVSDVIWTTDMQLDFTYFSPSAEKLLGYTAEELPALTLDKIMAPESLDLAKETFREEHDIYKSGRRDSKRSVNIELELLHKEGHKIWSEMRTNFLYNASGEPIGIIGVARNITERKLAEKALRESESGLRMAQELAHVGSWEWNLENNTMKMSEELLRIYGISVNDIPEEPLKLFSNLLHPDEKEAFIESLIKYIDEDFPNNSITYRIIRPDGETRWVCAMNHHIKEYSETNLPKVMVGVVQDITERKNAEKELQIKDYAISSSINGIAIADLDGTLTYVNDSLADMWGYKKDEMIGESSLDFFLNNEVGEMVNLSLRDHGYFIGELRATRKDGTAFDYLLSCSVVKDANGNPFCMMGSLIDITERKKMEDKLRDYSEHLEDLVEERTAEMKQAMDMAERANRAKSKFLANMSHELRTPLNSIIGFARLMRMGYVEEEYESSLANIIASGEHLLNLINDVLDISKIESGKMEFKMESIDMHELISKCIEIIRPLAKKKEINLSYMTKSQEARVFGDKKWVHQIFINLLNNAVKFTGRHGSINIETEEKKGTFYGRVMDTGIGISKENIDYIFEEFGQINSKDLDDIAEGTGLGLPITKKLVEAHSGEIYVESAPDEGSTFTVLLPCVRFLDTDESKEMRKKMYPIEAADSYILIVDDKKENRELLCSYLKKYKQKHLTAESGERSIELVNENSGIALVLMDIKMNRMSGTDAMKIIKTNHNIPVIAVTAFAMEGDCESLLAEGFDDYIAKPIDLDVLGEKIKRWLGKNTK